jgi:hypothetical protein
MRKKALVLPFMALAAGAVLGPLFSGCSDVSAREGPPSFNFEVQPILATHCLGCHGPDLKANKAGLRLDTFEGATAKLEESEGHAIVPGKPEHSELVARIFDEDAEDVMPPPETGKQLTKAEKEILRRWIASGARYERHWSLIPPKSTEVADRSDWSRNGIDPYVRQRLAKAGLKPNAEADKPTLLRRVTLALTGLPPTPEEVATFLADKSEQAYERVVDRLLASEAHAEHFARHWLDGARYADTHGIHIDNYRSIWPYRDWVIQAFRENKRWDAFTVEQIAGDLMPGATVDQKVATGFNRCLATTGEGGAIPEEYLAVYAKDRVDTTATLWLGLTVGCASCHDHKFDPISMRDFYRFAAFFRNTTMSGLDGNNANHPPNLLVLQPADRSRMAELEKAAETLQARLAAAAKPKAGEASAWAGKLALAPTPTVSIPLNIHGDISAVVEGKPVFLGNGLAIDGLGILGPSPQLTASRLQEMALKDTPALDGKGYSWSAWIYATGKGNGPVFSRMDSGNAFRGIDLWLEGGKIGAHAIESWDSKANKVVSNQVLPAGWHHVTAVWDGTKPAAQRLSLYLNGTLAPFTVTKGTGASTLATEAPYRIGARSSGNGREGPLQGGAGVRAQGIRVHNRALAADEVMAMVVSDLTRDPGQGESIDHASRSKLLLALYGDHGDPEMKAIRGELAKVNAEREALRKRGVITLVMDEKPGAPYAHVLNRGEYASKGEKVGAGTPPALHPFPKDAPRNRLGLAKWLVDPANPLMARVTMNRLWHNLFGTGIVETVEDFGITGATPSHPELLDWLALEFQRTGWDHRAMAKTLVMSATFRQSAKVDARKLEVDPANRLLSRGPRHRLDAEVIRDQALAASGLLVRKVGGPSVRPYQPEGIWEAVAMKASNTRSYKQDAGEGLWRRSVYTFWKRTAHLPSLDIFNAPSREVCTVRRERTNTPLQALVMLNDPQYVEAARVLAEQALATSRDFDGRLDAITTRVIARKLAPRERAVARRLLDAARTKYNTDAKAAAELVAVGARPAKHPDKAELAAWTLVASKVLNLDEALSL